MEIFFPITTDGCLGIGPESTRLGDQIVVVGSARSPFVLRHLDDSADYALIGDFFALGSGVRDLDARL